MIISMRRCLKIIFYGITLNYVLFLTLQKVYWLQGVTKQNVENLNVKHLHESGEKTLRQIDDNVDHYDDNYYANSKTKEKDILIVLTSSHRPNDENGAKRENELERRRLREENETEQDEKQDTTVNVNEDNKIEKSKDNLGLNVTDEKVMVHQWVNIVSIWFYFAKLGRGEKIIGSL